MKKFLLLSTLLCCTIITTLILGEFLVRTMPNPYKVKNKWMTEHSQNINSIILGSSHTYYGVRPEYVDSLYNLANVSQNPKYDYFMLEKYGNLCPNLKTVILPISYFTLFDKSFEDGDEWYYELYYKIYMDCPYHSGFSKYSAEMFHLSVYFGKLGNWLLGRSNIKCDSLGWGMGYSLANKIRDIDNANSMAVVKKHTAEDWSYLEENCFYLDKIVSYCKLRNIKLILITTPAWHTYYDNLDKRQLNKMYEVIRKIPEVKYYDYLKDKRFVEDDFYDPDHLSDIGARKFTLILKSEVLDKD